MGVYIKGMEMPPNCYLCGLTNDGFYLCKVAHPYKQLEDDCEERRPDWCPIVEVPPHGRLIDADKAKEHMDYVCNAGGWLEPVTKAVNEYVKKHIDAEPTIIEREE